MSIEWLTQIIFNRLWLARNKYNTKRNVVTCSQLTNSGVVHINLDDRFCAQPQVNQPHSKDIGKSVKCNCRSNLTEVLEAKISSDS